MSPSVSSFGPRLVPRSCCDTRPHRAWPTQQTFALAGPEPQPPPASCGLLRPPAAPGVPSPVSAELPSLPPSPRGLPGCPCLTPPSPFPSKDTCHWIQGPFDDVGCSPRETLNLIRFAKIFSPHKIIFTDSGGPPSIPVWVVFGSL